MGFGDRLRYFQKQLRYRSFDAFLIILAVSLSVLVFLAVLSPAHKNIFESKGEPAEYAVSVESGLDTISFKLQQKSGLPIIRFKFPENRSSHTLTLDLVERIYKEVPGIDYYLNEGISTFALRGYSLQSADGARIDFRQPGLLGQVHLSPEAIAALGFDLTKGSLYTKDDFLKNRPYLVLGSNLAKKLFGNDDPVGKNVETTGPNYTVLGVLGSFEHSGLNKNLLLENINDIALTSYANIIHSGGEATYYGVKFYPKEPTLEVYARINAFLEKHHPGLFDVTCIQASVEGFNTEYKRSYIALGYIAAFILLIACVNIINLLFSEVSLQNRAIGINMALGATRTDIFYQYAFSSLFQGFLGSCIGIILFWSISKSKIGIDFGILFSTKAISVGLLAGLLMSLSFGIYPAVLASKVSPIEALQME